MKKYIFFSIIAAIFFLSFISGDKGIFYTDTNGNVCLYENHIDGTLLAPPVDSALMFPHSSACQGCHSEDPNGLAMVDFFGNDVSFNSDWEASMMANSAKDPYWRAKVSHEVMMNPTHKDNIESSCTSCHAPMGHYTAILRGAPHYSIEDLVQDTIGLDGVSCGSCHKIAAEGLGTTFSGQFNVDTNRVVYGPFILPFGAPMQQFVGFEPLYSPHVQESELCASCHTLIVESIDLDGELTGNQYVEQATYHEWLNSEFSQNDKSCQSCHLPVLEEPVVVSANYQFLNPRPHYSKHELVGGNVTMLELMKNNKDSLGITASVENYERTISKTLEMLQQNSIDAQFNYLGIEADSVLFELSLENKAGHKFPSGFPSRRAFVEFLVVNELNGDTLFHTGKLRSDYSLENYDEQYEPHYDVITQEDQVQVYELVPADINGDFTTLLERGYQTLKDNRLIPKGFSFSHASYDTVAVVGEAYSDLNFGRDDMGEGTGTDKILFKIPMGTFEGQISARAKLHYQSLSPRWIDPLLADNSPEIDKFREMYYGADLSTIIVEERLIENLDVVTISSTKNRELAAKVSIYPNPLGSDKTFTIQTLENILNVEAYGLNGKSYPLKKVGLNTFTFEGLSIEKTVFIRIKTQDAVLVKKLIL